MHTKITRPRPTLLLSLMTAVMLLTACSRQTAEEKGRELASDKIDMVKGVGDVLGEKGSAAAESVAGGLGKVVNGLGKGLEKSGRAVALSPSVTEAHIQITKVQDARPTADKSEHGLEAYVLSGTNVDGQLRVKLHDLLDREIGRTQVAVKQAAEEGHYVSIPLDTQISLADIARVTFDYVATPSTAKK